MAHSHVLTPANGPLDARVLFVAEAPGRRGAAITGIPLHGDESGRRFERFLDIAGLTRSDVFVTNAVLCNPLDAHGHNRTPALHELSACRPYLEQTIAIVDPPVIVTLGAVALATLAAIQPHRATLASHVATPTPWSGRTLLPLYHPGRQSTVHRPHEHQEKDWRRLASLNLRISLRDWHSQPQRPTTNDQRPTPVT
jgi:uracil-DNA glycosylase family 4